MEISFTKNYEFELRKVFSGVLLISEAKEEFGICMRDSGFEFTYAGKNYEAKDGQLKLMEITPYNTAEKNDIPLKQIL